MVWGNVFEARTFLRNYAIINKFKYYQVKNENYRLRYKYGDEKCEWMCYVRRNYDGHTMELKSTSNITHTCRGKVVDKNKLAHTGWVANEVVQLIRSMRSTRPCDVQEAIWTKYGVDVSYSTTWNAWTICMERIVGSYDEGYIVMLELTVQVLLANLRSISTCICVLIPMRHLWIEYCSEYHTVAKYVTTYNLPIHAIDDPSEWGQPGYTVLPPPLVRGPGRPKKQKIKDQDEYLATVGDVENVVLWVT
ncbi:hypothetical protein GIB67_004648 [Kingdonia uniflora]|uniref:Transposase MuDR plant domain-containing protein n=1 Tax=Kingdonia uniflora TaxID=39325 RepID=A0A7J7MD35_9MAGN|nr:hypothetical protein GIB67_004648 [Kingdonia uniflora]